MATLTGTLATPSVLDSAVLTTSLADYQPTFKDNVYNANVVLRLANQNKKTIDGGLSIVEKLIEKEQNNGGFYTGADVLENTQDHTTTMVEYKWQNAYEPIAITRDEERINSGSEHKLEDLVSTKIMLSEKAMGKRLEQSLSTAITASGNLKDLSTVVNTAQLGTISGSTDTFWQSTVIASGAFATQGLSDMATAYYAVSSSANEENPTQIVTTKAVWQKYEDTRLPLQRIGAADLSANAGFKNITFKGVPVIYGNYIDSGVMYGLNFNYLYLAVDSSTDMVTTEFKMPVNQMTKVAYILWRGNLVTNNRRRQFKLTGIS